MVTAHLLVSDVCQPGSSAAAQLSEEKLHTFLSWCCSVCSARTFKPSRVKLRQTEKSWTRFLSWSATTNTAAAVSASISPDDSLRPPAEMRTASHPPRLLTRGGIGARAAYARAYVREEGCSHGHRKPDNSTSAGQWGGEEGRRVNRGLWRRREGQGERGGLSWS